MKLRRAQSDDSHHAVVNVTLLIDVDPEQVTTDDLIRRVAELETTTVQASCRAGVMQSCITAGIAPVALQ